MALVKIFLLIPLMQTSFIPDSHHSQETDVNITIVQTPNALYHNSELWTI